MSIISIKLRNFKVHENLSLKFQGKSVYLIGDTRQGKSSVMDAIEASLGISEYPKNSLRDGAKEGGVELTIDVKGKQYTIIREFDKNGMKRFRMIGDKNDTYVWKEEVEKIFGGLKPSMAYFDYARYFFEEKSALKRFEYAMQCCVGETYFSNAKRITELKKSRNKVGAQKKLLTGRLQGVDINEENYEELILKYQTPKSKDEIQAKKERDLKEKRTDVAKLAEEVATVKEHNKKHYDALLERDERKAEILAIDEQIRLLQEQREQKSLLLEQSEAFIRDTPLQDELLEELTKKMSNVNVLNEKVEEEINAEFDAAAKEIDEFNAARTAFLNSKTDYDAFVTLEKEWKQLDDEVENIKDENIQLFKEKVPLEGLEIKEIKEEKKEAKGKKQAEEEDQEDEEVSYELWYNGRELNRDNVSKGESVKITAQIQKALNPDSLKVLMIPEGQSMGSDLDDILAEAHAEGYQTIVEITERKAKFEMRFELDSDKKK